MARQATVELAPGVWRVPLVRDFVNGFILRDADGQVTLIDMGLKSSGPKVIAALSSIGSGPSDVTRLLLTHAHVDHAGGAAHVAKVTGQEFGVHTDDAEYARTGQSPPQQATTRLGKLMQRLSPPATFDPVPVSDELTDGQVLPVAGGLRVIHTPGHSPGHAAYFHESSGVLITGDSIFNVLGLRWPVKSFCTDFRMTQQTAHRLTELQYDVAAFTHGPEIRDAPREHIRRFLAKNPVR
ncbi:MAG: MBL fold metallo-hydrolase [Nocardioides sp.]|nr:MBL fold metallo-hydrolase [Nocardioides sp.]